MTITKELFQELNFLVESEQYESAMHICDKIKAQGCLDHTVQRTKVYCLIQRKMWNQALSLINFLEQNGVDLPYEKSYCLYRMNHLKKALEVLESLGDPRNALQKEENRAICYLKTQILYRLGRLKECNDLYSILKSNLSQNHLEELEMLEINQLAVNSLLSKQGFIIEDNEVPEYITDSFEYWFNRCCLYLSIREFDNALTALEMSESIYNSKENVEDQKLNNSSDLCSFKLMRAYILQQCGNNNDAMKLYEECFKEFGLDKAMLEPSMIHLSVVAYNNSTSILKNQKLYTYIDGLKRLSITSKDQIEHKMTINQNFIISLNKALIQYNEDEFRRYLMEAEKYSRNDPRLDIFKIGICLLRGNKKKALFHLDLSHKKYPGEITHSISLIRILLKMGRINLALKMIDSILEQYVNFENLNISANTFEQFIDILIYTTIQKFSNSALEIIKQKLNFVLVEIKSKINDHIVNKNEVPSLLCILGNYLLKCGLYKEASECFLLIVESFPNSDYYKALTGYIASSTLSGLHCPKKYVRQLDKELPKDIYSIDPEQLENSDVPKSHTRNEQMSAQSVNGTNEIKKKSRKRRRKPKYPKGFDPLNPKPLDPERWLPKEQRSSFKKMRNRSQKKGQVERGGHQGALKNENNIVKDVPSTAKQSVLTENSKRIHRRKRR